MHVGALYTTLFHILNNVPPPGNLIYTTVYSLAGVTMSGLIITLHITAYSVVLGVAPYLD